jgi:hypothetical protein
MDRPCRSPIPVQNTINRHRALTRNHASSRQLVVHVGLAYAEWFVRLATATLIRRQQPGHLDLVPARQCVPGSLITSAS